jgi:carbon monoxide dehydrogenase subunit G
MEMTGTQLLPVPQQIAWDALNDPEVLKASIMGCDLLERTSDTEFNAGVTAAIGPVKAKFKAKLTLMDVNAPNSYTIKFDGQGGAAGFGKGEASVKLTPEGEGTRLDYTAKANVGGKLAQIGSRLVDAASKKMADDFFGKFNAELVKRNPAAASAAPASEPAAPAAAVAHAPAPAPSHASADSSAPLDTSGNTGFGGQIAIFIGLCVVVGIISTILSKL